LKKLSLDNVERLTDVTWRIRQALNLQGFPTSTTSSCFGPGSAGAKARNFVLCPGKAYDRSPCGTGTSAKLACLAADGKLAEGEAWVQESIVGSRFGASYLWLDRASGRWRRASPAPPSSPRRARCCWTSAILFCWGIS